MAAHLRPQCLADSTRVGVVPIRRHSADLYGLQPSPGQRHSLSRLVNAP